MLFQGKIKHHVSKVFPTIFRDLGLLFEFTVVLKAENERIVGGLESALRDGLDDVPGQQLVDDGVSMGDVGLLLPVPEVQLDAAAAGEEDLAVHLEPGAARDLVTHQVGVVARGDEVV